MEIAQGRRQIQLPEKKAIYSEFLSCLRSLRKNFNFMRQKVLI